MKQRAILIRPDSSEQDRALLNQILSEGWEVYQVDVSEGGVFLVIVEESAPPPQKEWSGSPLSLSSSVSGT